MEVSYVAGQYGGGAFLLEFVLFTLIIGLPLLMTEFSIGQTGSTYSTAIFGKLTANKIMNGIGYLGNMTAFILYAFYSVIGGWIIIFIGYYLLGSIGIVKEDIGFFLI